MGNTTSVVLKCPDDLEQATWMTEIWRAREEAVAKPWRQRGQAEKVLSVLVEQIPFRHVLTEVFNLLVDVPRASGEIDGVETVFRHYDLIRAIINQRRGD